jgi:hypothetical protein
MTEPEMRKRRICRNSKKVRTSSCGKQWSDYQETGHREKRLIRHITRLLLKEKDEIKSQAQSMQEVLGSNEVTEEHIELGERTVSITQETGANTVATPWD